jgi:hypothetical protein
MILRADLILKASVRVSKIEELYADFKTVEK